MPWLAGRGLAFAHAPKTGGTWAKLVLEAETGKLRKVGRMHGPPGQLPKAERRKRRVVTIVREPSAWYRSLYSHALTLPRCEPHLRAYGGGSLDFASVLYGMTHPHEVGIPVPVVPIVHAGQGIDDPDAFKMSGAGLWTWATGAYLTGADVVLRQEALTEELGALLGADLTPYERVNTAAQRGSAPLELSQAMRGWIRDADGALGAALGYQSPARASSSDTTLCEVAPRSSGGMVPTAARILSREGRA